MKFLQTIRGYIEGAITLRPAAGGPGRFDSVGGTYDEQTSFGFDKQMFTEARSRTFIGALSRGGENIDQMYAGAGPSINGSNLVVRKEITEGDEVRLTMQEHIKGMPTYGDRNHVRGDFLAYKNMKARVNAIKSPAIPIVGKMAQQRVKASITDIPASVKSEVVDYMAEQMEIEAILALLMGAGPSVLLPTAQGGLGESLGVGAGAGAGVPLMGMHWYTHDSGFISYNTTPATWNAAVNTAIQNIDASSDDSITLAQIKTIRRKMDKLHWWDAKYGGSKYKAIALTDPDVWYRLDYLMEDKYKYARERSADNPIFGVDHDLVYEGIRFVAVPNLEKFRPAYDAGGRPLFGPDLTLDPRDYSTSSTNGLVVFMGGRALVEGYNGSVETKRDTGYMGDGVEIAAETKLGYVRGEWYAKDGRTDATAAQCFSVMTAAFYEPGVGTNMS